MKTWMQTIGLAVLLLIAVGAAHADDRSAATAAMRSRMQGAQIMHVRVAETWALGTWVQDPAGGQVLVHKVRGRWKFVDSWGGAMENRELKKYGIPSRLWARLTGHP